MKPRIDSYTLFARALPVYLGILPVVLLLTVVLPVEFKLTVGGAAGAALVLLSFSLGQVAADFGKKIEGALWRKWGGPPTTRFLRHGNQEFNEVTRQRVHEKLRRLGLRVPSEEEQLADPDAADDYFESCVHELIRRSRDRRRFPLVSETLTGYGFRRNLLGVKWLGLVLTIVALAGSAWKTYAIWDGTEGVAPVSLAVGVVCIGLLLIWMIWVNEETVRLGAERYARFLLEAALDLG